jgi:hypothetical protein
MLYRVDRQAPILTSTALILTGDELAQISGGDSPINTVQDTTFNQHRGSDKTAAALDAVLRQ